MDHPHPTPQNLVSLPPAMAESFLRLSGNTLPDWFAACDPPGSKLGSGGGLAHLLAEAWRAGGENNLDFPDWLENRQKLLLMAGGQSRRLPAYAPTGKLMLPMPVLRWTSGQHLEQNLMDLQMPGFRKLLEHAGNHYRVLMTSGDVFLQFDPKVTDLPEADIIGFGMWVRPEVAKHFGVFFSPRENPKSWAFFRQKPSASEIRELAGDYFYLVDTGMWLLSAKAVEVLMRKCGWQREVSRFASGIPSNYELYSDFGLALGSAPALQDSEINALRCAVHPLTDAKFFHLGTSRQMIEAVSELQNLQLDQTQLGDMAARPHPDQYILNSDFRYPRRLDQNHTLWVENSVVPESWQLAHDHVITGVPENQWAVRLEPGVCLDFVPVGERDFCVRAYGMDDPFRGKLSDPGTLWLGRPFHDWLQKRDLATHLPELGGSTDLQQATIFPILPAQEITAEFLEWLTHEYPADSPACRRLWEQARKISAEEICSIFSPDRLLAQRKELLAKILPSMAEKHKWNPFYRLDLKRTAELFVEKEIPLPRELEDQESGALNSIRDAMFRATVERARGHMHESASWEQHAFQRLGDAIISQAQMQPVLPRNTVLEDQILWGRSPVRIDLAGGWSDTPPFCLSFGGRVVNLAVNLNGQPPIQVFAKACPEPCLVLRSIDLGVETRISTYEELAGFAQPGSEFALAKAALALVGFLPSFHKNGGFSSLEKQLLDFGSGIEVSLLAAVPKGSGLGTSSILSATLLAVLADFCGLAWDQSTLSSRTLALEQMLTTGGGWQDQIGGITRGAKLVETAAGFSQKPSIRYLPEHLFDSARANQTALLYYTGITRLAKNILQDIVRGMFLNSAEHLEILHSISEHALFTSDVMQQGDWQDICRCVDRSWQLNKALDAGTNPPAVQAILDRIAPWLAACKLPGAGGGGYLFLLAKDEDAGRQIRRTLESNPPNGRARFVDFELSHLGLQVTRS